MGNETLGKREQRKEEKRNKILSAAKEVFLEKGYHNASISDIIGKTDLARGTFYLYFQSKKEIFDSLIGELFLSITKNINRLEIEALAEEGELERQLKSTLKSLFKVLGEHQDLVKIVLTTSIGLDNEFDRKVESYHKLMIEVIRLMISRGIEAHNWVRLDSTLFAHIIYGGLKEVIFQWLVNNQYKGDLNKETEQIIKVFLAATKLEKK